MRHSSVPPFRYASNSRAVCTTVYAVTPSSGITPAAAFNASNRRHSSTDTGSTPAIRKAPNRCSQAQTTHRPVPHPTAPAHHHQHEADSPTTQPNAAHSPHDPSTHPPPSPTENPTTKPCPPPTDHADP